ncbi:predicted protein [Verticillium alfalfae VaMs.102]|uniref:Predicted protein n=1 Tax=Verticillium alfalfae (strain VaMs.102 / ATCC MYA-4576 / FGSC 10136) TaxID=526221 RepID=C9SV45_VERA1|nr:predicted protein [Verticillium alfalfae VaMs.102]EEY22660.1 predicted protein [Verticillium alfalfae VaMs.102]
MGSVYLASLDPVTMGACPEKAPSADEVRGVQKYGFSWRICLVHGVFVSIRPCRTVTGSQLVAHVCSLAVAVATGDAVAIRLVQAPQAPLPAPIVLPLLAWYGQRRIADDHGPSGSDDRRNLAKTGDDLLFEKVGWDQNGICEVIVRLARGLFVTIDCMSGRDVPTPSQPSILLCLSRRLHTPQKRTVVCEAQSRASVKPYSSLGSPAPHPPPVETKSWGCDAWTSAVPTNARAVATHQAPDDGVPPPLRPPPGAGPRRQEKSSERPVARFHPLSDQASLSQTTTDCPRLCPVGRIKTHDFSAAKMTRPEKIEARS